MPRLQPLGVGHEQVVADELDAFAEALGERRPAVPVLLVHAVLDRERSGSGRRGRPSSRPARPPTACGPRARARSRRPRRSRSSPGRARSRRPRRARSRRPRCRRSAASSAASLESRSGAKPPSSPTAVPSPRSCSVFLSAWKTSAPIRRPSANVLAPTGHDHELLEVDLVVGVRAAVEHVHHRHRQHVRRLAAEVAPQRLAAPPRPRRAPPPATRRGSRWRPGATCSACRRARSARSSRPRWSNASRPLHRLGDLAVDVGHGLADALARPGVAAVAQLGRLELAGRRARGHGGAPVRARAQRQLRPRRSGCRASRGSGARGRARSGSSLSCRAAVGRLRVGSAPPRSAVARGEPPAVSIASAEPVGRGAQRQLGIDPRLRAPSTARTARRRLAEGLRHPARSSARRARAERPSAEGDAARRCTLRAYSSAGGSRARRRRCRARGPPRPP